MRLAIAPELNKAEGGVYQYSLTMLRTLHGFEKSGLIEECICLAHNLHTNTARELEQMGMHMLGLEPPSAKRAVKNTIRRILRRLPRVDRAIRVQRETFFDNRPQFSPQPTNRDDMREWLQCNHIDAVIYPGPNPLSFEIGLPYAMSIHDLQHRLQQDRFPELVQGAQYERREYIFQNAVKTAKLLLVDSEIGKEDVLEQYRDYGANADRIEVLPFVGEATLDSPLSDSAVSEIESHLDLPDAFLFYPAQYWAHKNHIRILEALNILQKEKGFQISVLFCGSFQGPLRQEVYRKLNEAVKRFGLSSRVRHLGYVSKETLAVLYQRATALVMPTYFGPTNIPVIEAWQSNCPVISSDIRGIREQIKDAGLLADPDCADSLAEQIYRICNEPLLRRELKVAGHQRIQEYGISQYTDRLRKVLHRLTP
jgi:glycosyltransferase involved in cell wall biosynthesis